MVPGALAVVKFMAPDGEPAQMTRSVGWLTCAVGFTVIGNDFVGPGQLTTPSVK